jgi:hypothetical protein
MREREERDYLGGDLLRKDRQWVLGILGKRKRVLGEADTVAPTQKTLKKRGKYVLVPSTTTLLRFSPLNYQMLLNGPPNYQTVTF